MKINFLIPFISKSGGIIVVLEYYRILKKNGHDVLIYYPLIPHWPLVDKNKTLFFKIALIINRFLFFRRRIEWYFERIPVCPVYKMNNMFIRNADISVATAWPTAYDVNNLNDSKGKKFYLVQGHEIWIPDKRPVEDSYRLPLKIVTISPWLSDIMKTRYNREVECEIYNGLRTDKFLPPVNRADNPITVSLQYHELECKGVNEALEALARIKNEFPDIIILLFGLFKPPEYKFNFQYYRNPDHKTLLDIYQRSHIFLFPSRGEGWGMTPLEAMACKCAIVGTDTGSLKVLGNDKNMLRIEPGSQNSIYQAIKCLITDRYKREQIAENGFKTVKNCSWEKAGGSMEQVFLNAIK